MRKFQFGIYTGIASAQGDPSVRYGVHVLCRPGFIHAFLGASYE